jgi:hypothetical protein
MGNRDNACLLECRDLSIHSGIYILSMADIQDQSELVFLFDMSQKRTAGHI